MTRVQRRESARSGRAIGETTSESIVWTSSRKPTINDVARLARVSKKTISRVINASPSVRTETRERIESIIRQIGYDPSPQARGLATQRSFLLGLVYDNPNAQYIVNVQMGILSASRDSGYELVVHPADRASPGFITDVRRFVERQKLDGVILIPPVSENEALTDALNESGCRYVRIIVSASDTSDNCVVYHDWESAAEIASHFVELGHRDIGLISGPPQYRSSHERSRGFTDRLAELGVKLPASRRVEGAYTFESGYEAADKLLRAKRPPTAIFASNDEMAAGAYKAALSRGLSIPGDISVAGFDDSPLATRLWPALTTVRLPIHDMGRLAAERLIRRITQAHATLAPAEVTGHLVVRESTAAPRGD